MPETPATTVRLNEQDRANAETIIRSGAAQDTAGAIRVALALVATKLVALGKRKP